jgi:hypothetical protein
MDEIFSDIEEVKVEKEEDDSFDSEEEYRKSIERRKSRGS